MNVKNRTYYSCLWVTVNMNTESATRFSAKTQAVITPSTHDGGGWFSHTILSNSWIRAHQASLSKIFQTRILESVTISSSRGSSWPRVWTCVSCTAGGFFTTEPPGKPWGLGQTSKLCVSSFLSVRGSLIKLFRWFDDSQINKYM